MNPNLYLHKGGIFLGDTQIDKCENENLVGLKFLVDDFQLKFQDYGYYPGLEGEMKDMETAIFHLTLALDGIKIDGTDYSIGQVKKEPTV